MKQKALTGNAADVEQVAKAKKAEQFSREDELLDLVAVLELPAGRRFLWRMLEQCRTFESIMETSAKIYYNAGRQDLGHFILAEIGEADPELWLQMQREAIQRTRNDIEPEKTKHDDSSEA